MLFILTSVDHYWPLLFSCLLLDLFLDSMALINLNCGFALAIIPDALIGIVPLIVD